MTANLISTTKVGAASYALVSGVTPADVSRIGLRTTETDAGIEIVYTNKREYGLIIDLIDAINAGTNRARSSSGSRRIVLARAARANGMNHGKTWVADLCTVDTHSLPPEWEGEEVCYVYE